MKIYVNGCSHTAGTDVSLNYRPQDAWPFRLQEKLGCELVNDSFPGSSNDRIFRTTVTSIASDPIPPDLAIIQFTQANRFELPAVQKPTFQQILPETYWTLDEKFLKGGFPINVSNVCKQVFSTSWSNELVHDKMFAYVKALQEILVAHCIEYYFVFWWPVDNYIWDKPIARTVDKTRIVTYNGKDVVPFPKLLKKNNFSLSNIERPDGSRDKHYQADAHQWMADQYCQLIKYGDCEFNKHRGTHSKEEWENVVNTYD